MIDDVIQPDHRERIKKDEDEVKFNVVDRNATQWRPLIVEPPICDEQEWHHF